MVVMIIWKHEPSFLTLSHNESFSHDISYIYSVSVFLCVYAWGYGHMFLSSYNQRSKFMILLWPEMHQGIIVYGLLYSEISDG